MHTNTTSPFEAYLASASPTQLTEYEAEHIGCLHPGLQAEWNRYRWTTARKPGGANPEGWASATARMHLNSVTGLVKIAEAAGLGPVDKLERLIAEDTFNRIVECATEVWRAKTLELSLRSLRTLVSVFYGGPGPRFVSRRITQLAKEPRKNKWPLVFPPSIYVQGARKMAEEALTLVDRRPVKAAWLARNAALLALAAALVPRLGELTGLLIGDVRRVGAVLHVYIDERNSKPRQTQKRSTVWDEVIQVYEIYMSLYPNFAGPVAPDKPLWPLAHGGGALGYHGIWQLLARTCERISGVRGTTNLLRRGAVMSAQSASASELLLGHGEDSTMSQSVYSPRLGSDETMYLRALEKKVALSGD